MKICDGILWAMETQRITAIVTIDLNAGFDTVGHDILLDALEKRFGLSGNVVKSTWVHPIHRPKP